uniref:Anaphase-promoting complex subunit 4 WD40 domain-containing protein n=1 Tax=Leersia perrieri TaxID=77586 RepID=A0A0D9WNR7_9ORYZ
MKKVSSPSMSLNPEEGIISQTIPFSSHPSLPSLYHSYNSSTSSCHHQCIATLRSGNSSYISGLAVVDGDSLYVASSDGQIRLWPLHEKSQSEVVSTSSSTVAVTNSSVKCLLSTGDNGLVSSHQDGTIRVWRRHAAGDHHLAMRAVLPTAADRLRAFLLPASHVDAPRRHGRRASWVRHVDAVTALAVSPDGAVMYSVSWDRSLKAWRLPGLRCAESVAEAHDDAVNAVVAAPDWRHVYTASADATVKAWRWRPEEGRLSLVSVMARHGAAVNALAIGGGGDGGWVLYSGGCDRSVVVWESEASGDGGGADDVRVMVAGVTLRGHKKAVLCLAAAGDVVCSGSADRTVRVWRREAAPAEGYSCLAVLDGHGGAVKSLAVVRRGEGCDPCCSCDVEESSCCGCAALVCSGSLDCDVKLWRVAVSCL